MKKFNNIDDLISSSISGKKILVRADLNVPVRNGKISDNTRIIAAVPTINELLKQNCKIIIVSHFGRPKGRYDSSMSLSPLVDPLQDEINKLQRQDIQVKFASSCIGTIAKNAIDNLSDGEVLLLENLRFHEGEESDDAEFAEDLASNADYYVNDAFSASHRSHASITGVAKILPSFAGKLLEKEATSLQTAFETPKRPLVSVVGGSKVSTKIDILNSLASKSDYLIIGGGMANTFLYAKGKNIGSSLCEKDLKQNALHIIKTAKEQGCKILLPIDAVVSNSIEDTENTKVVDVDSVPNDKMILDAGTKSIISWHNAIVEAKTVIWNGPLGAFEFPPFDNSSVAIARSVAYETANNNLLSVAGGGDTLSLLSHSGIRNEFSYISTAGGAFLEWLEGKDLPGIEALKKSAEANNKAA